MGYSVRMIREEEYGVLEAFLYEAIYVPEGMERPPKEIILIPELQVYLEDFGKKKDDYGFVALAGGEIIGAVWARIMNDYGHIDDETPSLALAVHESHRGRGIGTALMEAMMALLKENGYRSVSLSVQKSNPAFRLYQRLGFEAVDSVQGETKEEIICIRKLAVEE
ncbi:MAG: GNAT family N-acetyltransferase [Lachnospiraceae bacterium]